jgi:hypothetical protein
VAYTISTLGKNLALVSTPLPSGHRSGGRTREQFIASVTGATVIDGNQRPEMRRGKTILTPTEESKRRSDEAISTVTDCGANLNRPIAGTQRTVASPAGPTMCSRSRANRTFASCSPASSATFRGVKPKPC